MQRTPVSPSGPATTYAYDANGNLLSETTGSGAAAQVKSYSWDADNRLRKVTMPPDIENTFAYDANGLRVKKVESSGETDFLLDGSSVLEELDAGGAVKTSYLPNPQVIDEILFFRRAGATYYPLTDALGSVYAIVDSSGQVTQNYSYDVYGERTYSTGSGPNLAFGFTGREHDAEARLRYHRDRYADAAVGRWNQADRIGFVDGVNLYSYVRGRPTVFDDPNGFSVGVLPVPIVLDSWTATAVYHPLMFLALLAALGMVSEIIVSKVIEDCREEDQLGCG